MLLQGWFHELELPSQQQQHKFNHQTLHNMSNIKVTAEKINSLKWYEIIDDELVRQRYIAIYGALWGENEAEAAYEREAIHFKRIMRDNEKLCACTPMSIFVAFVDLAVCGLSLEPGVRALAYLQPRGFKAGTDPKTGKDAYEQRCMLTISGYGELVLRTRAGQIRHADNPVIVYEGDDFSFTDQGDLKKVTYTLNLNHNVQRPIACYLRITRADGSIDYSVMLEEDWKRLQGYSAKQNSYWDNKAHQRVEKCNDLYTSGEGNRIDSGFLMAKCIKHAFKTYPKVRIGRGTTYEADEQPMQDEDIYGISEETQKKEPESFAQPADTSAGVTVDPETSDTTSDDGAW